MSDRDNSGRRSRISSSGGSGSEASTATIRRATAIGAQLVGHELCSDIGESRAWTSGATIGLGGMIHEYHHAV
jgi:hypothetical protein